MPKIHLFVLISRQLSYIGYLEHLKNLGTICGILGLNEKTEEEQYQF